MTIEKFDRTWCGLLRAEINLALKELAKKHDVTIHAGNASYTDNSVTFKVECLIAGFDKAKDEFERSAFLFKLTTDDFGADFNYRGRAFKLVGLKPRSPKYPIIGEANGQRFKLPEASVAALVS